MKKNLPINAPSGLQGTRLAPPPVQEGDTGFASLGRAVPLYRRSAAIHHARDIGMKDTEKITEMIDRMCVQIAKDEPYQAMDVAWRYGLDLTACYRIMAVLLAGPKPRYRIPAMTRRF